MPDHTIEKATAEAEYSIVWENDLPQVGYTSNRRNTRWHCSCGETFGSKESAADHIEEKDND